MIKIGITGNIASGKTLIEKLLIQESVTIVDADILTHKLFENNTDVINQVCKLFAPFASDIKNNKGGIDRSKISNLAFNNKKLLKGLEKIIHPKVKQAFNEFFIKNKDKDIVAGIAPLLFESGMDKQFDYIIMIAINPDIQLKRLIKRNNLSKEQALKRINAQVPQDKKIKKADFLINNSYDIENTKLQLKEILDKIKSENKLK